MLAGKGFSICYIKTKELLSVHRKRIIIFQKTPKVTHPFMHLFQVFLHVLTSYVSCVSQLPGASSNLRSGCTVSLCVCFVCFCQVVFSFPPSQLQHALGGAGNIKPLLFMKILLCNKLLLMIINFYFVY